jgi:hypothetical protein
VEDACVLAQPRQIRDGGDAAEGDDENVIGASARGRLNLATVEVDAIDLGVEKMKPPPPLKSTDGHNDIAWVGPTFGDGPEQRGKQQRAISVDHEDADIVSPSQAAIEPQRRRHPAEAAAENQDAVCSRFIILRSLAEVGPGRWGSGQEAPDGQHAADQRRDCDATRPPAFGHGHA